MDPLHWCFHCPSSTNWVTANVGPWTSFPPPPHPFQQPFFPTLPPTLTPYFPPSAPDQSLLQDTQGDSIIFVEMIDEETNMAVAVSVHVYSDMTADLVFDEMPHCLSKVFAAPQIEQKPDKLEFEHSTAAAILSIECADMSNAIVLSSELNSDLDEHKTEEADFKTANLDLQPVVIVTADTTSEIEQDNALSIASICTDLAKSGVASSLYAEIHDNSGAPRYSIISKNVAAQHMLLHFPFDPGSAGGLVFDNIAFVFDNSLQLILPCIAPLPPNEFGEHPMVPSVSHVFDTMSQQCINILTPVVVSEWENGNSRPTYKVFVESFQRIDTRSPSGGIETAEICATILAAASESSLEDRNSNFVDYEFDISFLPLLQPRDGQLHARALFIGNLRLHNTFDFCICRWVDTGQQLQTGLGANIAKTLALAGIKSMILPDEEKVDLWDFSSYFIFLESDACKNRELSSCGLFNISYRNAPALFSYAPRTVSGQLCQDDMPMSCAVLANRLEARVYVAELLPVLIKLVESKSWRVYYGFPCLPCERCAEVGLDATKMAMIPPFVELLCDYEAEVRTVAADEIIVLSRILSPLCVNELSFDSSQHAPSFKALVMIRMTRNSRTNTNVEHLLQIFLSLLKDESSQVRLNITSKLEQVNQVIGKDLLSQTLLPVIVELKEDRHWMIQLAIIEFIPPLVRQLGVGFCNDKLGAILYAVPVNYLVGAMHFTPKDSIIMFWLFAHYPSLFKYQFAYFFVNESGGEKGKLQCIQKLDVLLWKVIAHQWLLVLRGFGLSNDNLLPPVMLLLLDLVFPGKSKVPPAIMFDSLVVHLDDFAHAILDLNDAAMILNEAVALLRLLNKTLSISGVSRFIHNLCFAGVFFERYSITGQVNFGASLAMFSQVAHDATNENNGPLRMLATVLKSLRHWIDRELFHYHDNSSGGSIRLMEILHSVLFTMMKIVEGNLPKHIIATFEIWEERRNVFVAMPEEMNITGASFDIAKMIQSLIMLMCVLNKNPIELQTMNSISEGSVVHYVHKVADCALGLPWLDLSSGAVFTMHNEAEIIRVCKFPYLNLEDKVLIEGGSIVMNSTQELGLEEHEYQLGPRRAKQPNKRLADCEWEPG